MIERTPAQEKVWLAYQARLERQLQRDRIRKVPFPTWPNKGKSWCVWCGERIYVDAGKKGSGSPNMRARWHKACVHDYNLHSRLETQFDHVARRDGLKCSWEGCGASPQRWHNLGESTIRHIREVPSFKHLGPLGSEEHQEAIRAWYHDNPLPRYTEIERRTALELDHRVALWKVQDLPDDQRRPYFGPRNLWLLCPAHHKLKTKREAAERAAIKRKAAHALSIRDRACLSAPPP